ncbi:hypothetical protein [Streptomyces sp. NPDC051567]|uniref:hypothetical protein n=1 Tax=Streptomyces sp. NPDC051567 TaxID=3365660 RepID=UPI0037892A68
MGWQSEEFGTSHEGRAAAVLPDGTEPGPRYFDTGSGPEVHTSRDWWVYDGTMGAPLAAGLRGACSCGWRGPSRHPLDWARVTEDRPYLFDTSGPYEDWTRHVGEVESRSVPLPVALEVLLERITEQLDALADDAPLAALKAVAALERTVRRVGGDAAHRTRADEVSWEEIGRALGLTEEEARSRLLRYRLGR